MSKSTPWRKVQQSRFDDGTTHEWERIYLGHELTVVKSRLTKGYWRVRVGFESEQTPPEDTLLSAQRFAEQIADKLEESKKENIITEQNNRIADLERQLAEATRRAEDAELLLWAECELFHCGEMRTDDLESLEYKHKDGYFGLFQRTRTIYTTDDCREGITEYEFVCYLPVGCNPALTNESRAALRAARERQQATGEGEA